MTVRELKEFAENEKIILKGSWSGKLYNKNNKGLEKYLDEEVYKIFTDFKLAKYYTGKSTVEKIIYGWIHDYDRCHKKEETNNDDE